MKCPGNFIGAFKYDFMKVFWLLNIIELCYNKTSKIKGKKYETNICS